MHFLKNLMLKDAENHPNEFQRRVESEHPLTPTGSRYGRTSEKVTGCLPTSLQGLNKI